MRPRAAERLRPERALYLDVGVEQRFGGALRWQATAFSRREADIVSRPDAHPRLQDGVVLRPSSTATTDALRGTSHGVEVVLERTGARGLSGWAAYSYGRTRQSDPRTGERYWSDSDQRHALNLFASYPLPGATTLGATFRAGSGFPVPGYFVEHEGRLVVGSSRNVVRLPVYARLDLRADHRFTRFGLDLTIFGEALNVLNRVNLGAIAGRIDTVTGEAIGFTDPLLPRRLAAGVVIDF
jgi:hypothetical protein